MDAKTPIDEVARRRLLGRFWQIARGFWGRRAGTPAWWLTGALLAIVLAQLFVQYRINVWNRAVFDALEKKDSADALTPPLLYLPLVLAGASLAVAAAHRAASRRRPSGGGV